MNRASTVTRTKQPNTVTKYAEPATNIKDESETTTSDTETSSLQEPIEPLTRRNVSMFTYDDVEAAQHLFTDDIVQTFNIQDLFNPIHRCCLSLKVATSQNKIVGVISMDECPNVPGLPTVGWSHWAHKLYNIKNLSSYNCMWIHCAAYDMDYKQHFLYPILNHFFHDIMMKKLYILVVIPAGCHAKVPYLDGVSSLVLPQGYTDPNRVQTIRLIVRQDFITQYKIRRAVEEDNDDLVPLINEFSPRFVELYGEYYVAEIITRHPEAGRKIIVAEHEGEAVSVLCLNPTVNYDQLNDCFDLHVFTGLYKTETAKQVPRPAPPPKVSPPMDRPPNLSHTGKSKSEIHAWELSLGAFTLSSMDMDSESMTTMNDKLTFSVLDNLDHLTRENSSGSTVETVKNQSKSAESVEETESSSESWNPSSSSELQFLGKNNAFAIEILAARAQHQSSLSLLIISCFECYQDRDYCLLMLPHDADYSSVLKYFVRVQPRLCAQHPHELYVCHRGQLTPVRVQIAYPAHSERVDNFIKLVKYPGLIRDNYDNGITTLIALSGKNSKVPIGLAQVAKVSDLNSIKMKYAIGQRLDVRRDSDFSFGYLLVLCMSPLFKRHLKYFMREIHRKTNFSTIFYALNRHDATDYRIRPMSFAMHTMWPVPPRKVRITTKKAENDYPEEPYALFISTTSLMSKPNFHVNHRIVVIGSSYTALSFVEKLITNESTECLVCFNNVILVSNDGLGRVDNVSHIRNMLFAKRSIVDADYLEKIALRAQVNVVNGTLTAINRREKFVRIDKHVEIPYEYLFLMTGLQYGVPRKKGVKDYIKVRLPLNCFTINTELDRDRALDTLRELVDIQTGPYQIIVYGHTIDCYCCIEALIEYGVPAEHIMLIDPWPHDQPLNHDFVFQDGDIYEKVVHTVKHLGVHIKTGYKLIDWSTRPTTLKFESMTRQLALAPMCAFLYNEKSVEAVTHHTLQCDCRSINVFRAIYDCGLVFDGRLVIDSECHTNDAFIYAAGTLTKYTRKLWADHLAHAHFNSEEIGGRLGRKIREMLLPFKEKRKVKYGQFGHSCWQTSRHLVPMYFKPMIMYCKLPGGLYYLNVCKPGAQIPLETAMSDTDYGSVLSTGSCKNLKVQGYFRIHLNVYRNVETITCLSLQKFEYKTLVLLWGKHEALLNNLVRRFESIYITDLFEYFQKAWCSAIFLDDFPQLESAIMKVMTSLSENPHESPLEDLYSMYINNGFKPLSSAERETINTKFADSGYDKEIQNLIMDYIRDNLSVLDMYAHPVIVNYVLSGYEESPMFKKI